MLERLLGKSKFLIALVFGIFWPNNFADVLAPKIQLKMYKVVLKVLKNMYKVFQLLNTDVLNVWPYNLLDIMLPKN